MRKLLHILFRKYWKVSLSILGLLLIWYAFCLPSPLFQDPVSLVLEDQNGQLLGARIAQDGQWRFPYTDSIPERFATAVIEFEDRRFNRHLGVDPWGLARAFRQNVRNRRIVSGGSTISMQVVRLARKNPRRTILRKVGEIIQATRLELGYRKKEILALWAANAPFGGNVVGLETATWRYFGKPPALLSWGEAATLAVLPNSPALIHPGRNRDALLAKRNRLLDRLEASGKIDVTTCRLAKAEPLPERPLPLPRLAPHLLDRAGLESYNKNSQDNSRIRTTLDKQLQFRATQTLERHLSRLKNNDINNLAALIVDVRTGAVKAYVGNILGTGESHGEAVDVITAPRSTGSILKPFLYSMALDEGLISPQSLLPDIPTSLSGYRPENFHGKFDGVIPAQLALSRSLNVPMVYLLSRYGLEKFHFGLQKLGLRTLIANAEHYGLPLVLGGAEASLWDLCNAYSGMAHTLNTYSIQDGSYAIQFPKRLHYVPAGAEEVIERQANPPLLSAGSIWLTFEAMQEVQRPDSEGDWRRFSSSRRLAWKTGTSFGFRDAWAIGVTPNYVIGVWAGNADGEGRPDLVGVKAAAPALFQLVDLLPYESDWFEVPYNDLPEMKICAESGYRPLPFCPVDTVLLPSLAKEGMACPYHQVIHLDPSGKYRVNATCMSPSGMKHQSWLVLPPVEEHFYKQRNPAYRPLPPFMTGCDPTDQDIPFQLIYPREKTEIYVPIDLDGTSSKTVFQATHRHPETKLYWHLDDRYLGSTETFHNLELNPAPGQHRLTLVDEQGNRLVRNFTIIAKGE